MFVLCMCMCLCRVYVPHDLPPRRHCTPMSPRGGEMSTLAIQFLYIFALLS
jgi:hypothetical protein